MPRMARSTLAAKMPTPPPKLPTANSQVRPDLGPAAKENAANSQHTRAIVVPHSINSLPKGRKRPPRPPKIFGLGGGFLRTGTRCQSRINCYSAAIFNAGHVSRHVKWPGKRSSSFRQVWRDVRRPFEEAGTAAARMGSKNREVRSPFKHAAGCDCFRFEDQESNR